MPTGFSYPCLLLSGLLVSGCATVHRDATPPVQSYQTTENLPRDTTGSSLRIMTVNIAHGRGESFHQLLQDTDTTVANLDSIARLLRCSGVDIVALQEADGLAGWLLRVCRNLCTDQGRKETRMLRRHQQVAVRDATGPEAAAFEVQEERREVRRLLDAIVDYLPSPADVPPAVGTHSEEQQEIIAYIRNL